LLALEGQHDPLDATLGLRGIIAAPLTKLWIIKEGVALASKETNGGSLALDDLERGMKMQGKITKTELYGAFVDVGLERDGLIHISQLKRGRVNRVDDVVKEGDTVEAWIQKLDKERGRIELTLIKPADLEWRDIKPGMQVHGKVVRLEDFGAFVDIGAERPGLVHVSEMSEGYVRSPRDVVSEGDEISVSVIDLDRKKRQISLSMKDQAYEEEEVEELPEEEPPTAMEVALKAALEKAEEEKPAEPRAKDKSKKKDETREDILERTLKHRVETSK
jgi:ribosomal protein S1